LPQLDRTVTAPTWTDCHARGERLARIVGEAKLAASFPLLQVVRMSDAQFARLEAAALAYLWHSLSAAFPERSFGLDRRLLVEYRDALLDLPNRTPNGVILPRRETFLSFNMIHQVLANVIQGAGMLSAFSHLQIPCNVRLVEGTPDRDTDSRSYSSTKIHTDVWNGEPISSILFNIPVLGDPAAVDLRFYEPRNFPSELRVALSDYKLGEPVASSVEEYPVAFQMKHLYISDALSLHQTVKRRPALRLSLDFRAIAREMLPGESADCSASRATYITPDAWSACGLTTILGSGEPLDGFHRRRAGEAVIREALSIRDVDDLSA
jgi:hypothetical protein